MCTTRTWQSDPSDHESPCDYRYSLCEYLAGDAETVDAVENIGVLRVDKAALMRYILADQLFSPIPESFEGSPT